MHRVSNTRIRELCGVTKRVDEEIDKEFLKWGDHLETVFNDRITKKVYVGECTGSCSVNRPRKRWIDTVNER